MSDRTRHEPQIGRGLLHLGGSDFTPPNRSWCSGFVPPFALDVMDSENIGATGVLSMFMNVLAEADV